LLIGVVISVVCGKYKKQRSHKHGKNRKSNDLKKKEQKLKEQLSKKQDELIESHLSTGQEKQLNNQY
jgi:hypothetical protein